MNEDKINTLISKNEILIHRVVKNLINKLDNSYNFDQRQFYAKSFLLASLHFIDSEKYRIYIDGLKKSIHLEKKTKTFHYEFNRYALGHVISQKEVDKLIGPRSYTWGKAANWSILRILTQIKYNCYFYSLSVLEILRIKIFFKRKDYIEDIKNFYSSQYNFFSLALLNELKVPRPLNFKKSWLEASINNCLYQVSSYGYTNFLGRGSFQSFGYSSLIYLLSFYDDPDNKINKTLSILLKIIDKELSETNELPLVLFGKESERLNFKGQANLDNKDFLGWYSYNNLLDYQSFCLLMLIKTSINLKKKRFNINLVKRKGFVEIANNIFVLNSQNIMISCGFQKIKNNELCLFNPIIFSKDKILMPPLGGEQNYKSLNNDTDFGLPKIYLNEGCEEINKPIHIKLIRHNVLEIKIAKINTCSITRRVVFKGNEIVIIDKLENQCKKSLSIDAHRIIMNKECIDIISNTIRSSNKHKKNKVIDKDIYSTYNKCIARSINVELQSLESIILRSSIQL